MKLSNKNIKQLHMLRELRHKPPSTLWFFRSNFRRYLYICILAVLAIGFYQWAGWPIAASFFAGFFFAILFRDFHFYRQFAKGWELSNEITDWAKVEELLANDQASAPQLRNQGDLRGNMAFKRVIIRRVGPLSWLL